MVVILKYGFEMEPPKGSVIPIVAIFFAVRITICIYVKVKKEDPNPEAQNIDGAEPIVGETQVRGGFELKYESAFFYEFYVTKMNILFDFQKPEAIIIICFQKCIHVPAL